MIMPVKLDYVLYACIIDASAIESFDVSVLRFTISNEQAFFLNI